RRKHPLSRSGMTLAEAMKLESQLLDPIVGQADMVIDTTHTNVHELRDQIVRRMRTHNEEGMSVLLQSFGFKHGIPSDADFVFDVRCLPNPHWEPSLRPLTGRDPEVVEFLEAQESVITMHHQIDAFLSTWIPQFVADNRNYLNVSIGCTGGQHRSVYMVESLGRDLADRVPELTIRHRELT
ncbi:MAG: RNase adapter RapZ, partial [Gammaproteobacteria bacterium]